MKQNASRCLDLLNNDKITFVRADDNTDMDCGDDIQDI